MNPKTIPNILFLGSWSLDSHDFNEGQDQSGEEEVAATR